MPKTGFSRSLAFPAFLAACAVVASCGGGAEEAVSLDRAAVVAVLGTEMFSDQPTPDAKMVELGRTGNEVVPAGPVPLTLSRKYFSDDVWLNR